jgi:hypothetical protein
MTHLSLLIVLCLTLVARDWWWERASSAMTVGWRHAVPPAVIAMMLLVPLVFVKRLRFDLQMPQPLLWDLARDIAGEIKDRDKLALVMPGDNGSDALMLHAALELTPPRRRDLDILDVSRDPAGLAAAVEQGYRRAVVSCVPGAAVPEAALMTYDGETWRTEKIWPYPATPAKERWTSVLSSGPLCREE